MIDAPNISEATASALSTLKDFQRETVEHVFGLLYGPGSSGRFLVADEVGLGKTMVARGVVAKAIDHLRATKDRVRVIYICSNATIASQNINRLTSSKSKIGIATRLTLLPTRARQLATDGVSFLSFTPATTFEVGHGMGTSEERVLIHALLREPWELGNRVAPMNVLTGKANPDTFRAAVDQFDLVSSADPTTVKAFRERLAAIECTGNASCDPTLRAEFEALCAAYPTARSQPDGDTSVRRSRLIGRLRELLAKTCVELLEPDLVILDEFQRFSDILHGTDEASELAKRIFEYRNAKILLLSATPYKMYTVAGDGGGEDHYQDFVNTILFLEGSQKGRTMLEAQLDEYGQALRAISDPEGLDRLAAARTTIEERLRRVMVRTERLASTPDRNGMLVEKAIATPSPTSESVRAYVALDALTKHFDQHDPMEYWKSAPFVLNFMDDNYALKLELTKGLEQGAERMALAPLFRQMSSLLLDWKQVTRYEDLAPPNPRMRELIDATVGQGAHELLWLPPALPYYELSGRFAKPNIDAITKRLIFSSWNFVPRAIAALLSYEAERRMVQRGRGNNYDRNSRKSTLLRFGREGDRLTGMPVLAAMYPSVHLAKLCDPLVLSRELYFDNSQPGPAALPDVLAVAQERIALALRHLPTGDVGGAVDERWYWAAPLLLDRSLELQATRQWCDTPDLAGRWSGASISEEESDEGISDLWRLHVEEAQRMLASEGKDLGRRPDDLPVVLSELALGGPGTTMLRSMLRVAGVDTSALTQVVGNAIRDGAARAAWNFRGLFNQPEISDMVRAAAADRDSPYWRQVLRYCAEGCLQSVLDEYVHILRDQCGLSTGSTEDLVKGLAEDITAALSLRTATLRVDEYAASSAGRTIKTNSQSMRCHFALRFGDQSSDDGVVDRADAVRKAFNSPFWPFVLATTSVGQEGLDFHSYCHALVHWNLPSNPVDLEQREGRIHRYKNHAVRKNVARLHGHEVLRGHSGDPWGDMFNAAVKARPPGATDIIPFWVYCAENGAQIERHVASIPLSREHEQMRSLSSALTMYRMVFGQPRQDDLVRHLARHTLGPSLGEVLEAARIELSPSRAP